jgi:4-hydroxyacetophenone monooxygenase
MLSIVASNFGKKRDAREIAAMLSDADIVPLLMSLVQMRGDERLLDESASFISGTWNFQESIPDNLRTAIIDRVAALLAKDGSTARKARLPRERIHRLIETATGAPVADEFIPLIMEEARLDPAATRGLQWRKHPDPATLPRFRVIIIGAGISGICMAIRLKQVGIDFVVVEKNSALGGTWHENTYPDSGVDTPSHFYSFSFSPNPDWSRHFAGQHEVWNYLDRCAREYGIAETIRFDTEALSSAFDEATCLWTVNVRDAEGHTSELRGNLVVTAVGQLTQPSIPSIPGLVNFQGPILHSGRWDHEAPLEGRRIVMVGTGASGIQIGPAIAKHAGNLSILQRSPHWVMHNPNYHKPITEGAKWAFLDVPFYANWTRFLLFWATGDTIHPHLRKDPSWPHPDISLNAHNHKMREMLIEHARSKIGDRPDLMEKVIPSYPPYGKRMLRDNQGFEMLRKPHVDLYNDKSSEIRGEKILLRSGAELTANVLVFSTGFETAKMIASPNVANAEGTTLRDTWGDDEPRAFLGVAVPNFPNLFFLYGPNSNGGHGGSVIFQVECQVRCILLAMRDMIENGLVRIEYRQESHDRYNDMVDKEHASLVWTHPGVHNWYKNKKGRVVTNSPWRLIDYWNLTREFDAADFMLTPNASLATSSQH